ncbi:AraC family transcriptional regulator [Paenibacillus sp. P26]|nr:AraC family transcriptional regulator [Paenibacillus sp. P26]
MIRYDEIGRPAGDTHKYFQQMDALCQAFRIADDSWRLQVDQLVHDLEQDLLKEEEIRHLLRHLLRLLQRTVEGPPPEMTDLWSGKVNPGLTGAIEESETSEELLCRCWRSLLKELHEKYVSLRESKNHHQLINEIRKYIEQNYANPDLSLNLISDQFNINAKYSDHLFKEEYGMKFVDFLMNLRMDQAKKLLLESDLSIQEISEKVGYTHSISFGRTFKKVVGVTPAITGNICDRTKLIPGVPHEGAGLFLFGSKSACPQERRLAKNRTVKGFSALSEKRLGIGIRLVSPNMAPNDKGLPGGIMLVDPPPGQPV